MPATDLNRNDDASALKDQGRRGFLRGRIGPATPPLRPPWAIDEAAFPHACTRCGQCAKVCEAGIIAAGDGGFPEIDFSRGGCTFCAACIDACDTGALAQSERPWNLKATIGPDCLSRNGVVCRSCGEACDACAIRFQLQPAGRAIPRIDPDLCTGCGECLAVCPIHAVSIQSVSEES